MESALRLIRSPMRVAWVLALGALLAFAGTNISEAGSPQLVRWMNSKGLSERAALRVIAMSASALRYQPRDDRNGELRAKMLSLAQRHRRYGVGMIYLKLRQAGHIMNYKRVERLYREQKL